MSGPRFGLASLLGIVAVLALGFAGLFSATTFWTSAAATITLGVLLTAALGAHLLQDRDRAFCLGFAVFGGAYLMLVHWDWVGGPFGHDLTAGIADVAESILPDRPPPIATAAGNATALAVPIELMRARQIRVGNFVEIGRCALALLFGLLGGYAGVSLIDRRDRGSPPAGLST
jgi:hypothetical protein